MRPLACLLAALSLMVPAPASWAQEDPTGVLDRGIGCARVPDPAARLSCFDEVFRELAQRGPAADTQAGRTPDKTAVFGTWTLLKDAVPGSPPKIHISTPAREEVRSWLISARPVLFFRCTAGKGEAFIDMGVSTRKGASFNGRSATQVGLILDSSGPRDMDLYRSVDGKALFFPKPEALARILVDRPAIGIDVPLSEGGIVRADFLTDGLREALGPYSADCGFN